jgi:hypothetical protein
MSHLIASAVPNDDCCELLKKSNYVHFEAQTNININNAMRNINISCKFSEPFTVAAPSKAWVCGRSLAGIVGSNPAGGMDACLL